MDFYFPSAVPAAVIQAIATVAPAVVPGVVLATVAPAVVAGIILTAMTAAVAAAVVIAPMAPTTVAGVVRDPHLPSVVMAGPALLRPGVKTPTHHQQQRCQHYRPDWFHSILPAGDSLDQSMTISVYYSRFRKKSNHPLARRCDRSEMG